MKRYPLPHRVVIVLASLALIIFALTNPAIADSLYILSDNPSYAELGFSYGFKIEPPVSGHYEWDIGLGYISSVDVSFNDSNLLFDWVSNFAVNAVIVKGGPNSNIFHYDLPRYADLDLHAPVNPDTGLYYAIASIEFASNNPSGNATVPEPSTMVLLGSGLAGIVGFSRRRLTK